MFRPAARSALRSAARSALRSAAQSSPSFSPIAPNLGKRFASTSPANARRTWKGSALRWGVAVAGIYYYNTSPVFAEQPQHNLLNPNLDALDDENHDHASLEALTSGRSRQAEKNASVLHSAANALSSENASTTVVAEGVSPVSTGSAAELEQEAAGEGAFNPETGEINWDCPCLGGMAHGPCGPQFREAFSCFVFSEQDPKGMDCIDKFQNMQQCFQQYPEVYKGELEDDEELSEGLEQEREELVNEIAERKKQQQEAESQRRLLEEPDPVPKPARATKKKQAQPQESQARTSDQESRSQSQAPSLPRDSFDAIGANQQSNKQPSEEAKVNVSDDATRESTMSPEREKIFEGQKSGITSESKETFAASGEQSSISHPDIVPNAAFDATSSTGAK